MEVDSPPRLDRDRHIKYWKRCAQLLPEPYSAGEASRMSFGFFIVAALDLLGALETATTAEEREGWINWIYTCQVPFTGGFRGFTGTMLGGVRSQYNWHWDPANLPNTYFALATLIMLGDDLSRVRRNECMKWVRSLQRKNGSFGEYLGEDHAIEGGNDPRLCMCAVGTLKLLQGAESDIEKHEIDQVRLQEYISNCQSHDGGIAQQPLLEAHSGLNYCGIATLSFLGLLQNPPTPAHEVAREAGVDTTGCTRWMLDRQTTWVEDEDEDEEEDEVDDAEHKNDSLDMSAMREQLETQKILQQHELVDIQALRRYLLEKVAHMIGGFAKAPGELPDLLHSYLGLATLAIYGEPALKDFDPTFCFSKEAVEKLNNVAWRRS
ncbi:geranylgeranyl transferase type-1 subunit beta [Exophiala xenobiotica]|nr:geranylgeranyl transferase type-1 subunit beta [Exophiala xenobiotica]